MCFFTFLYSTNAHEMCRLMFEMGVKLKKVWIQTNGLVHAWTNNNPYCFVKWNSHVAPTLDVRCSGSFRLISQRI
ncbi:protein-glutamine glutaminase family protein [Thermodesulfobacteriota bacterium]